MSVGAERRIGPLWRVARPQRAVIGEIDARGLPSRRLLSRGGVPIPPADSAIEAVGAASAQGAPPTLVRLRLCTLRRRRCCLRSQTTCPCAGAWRSPRSAPMGSLATAATVCSEYSYAGATPTPTCIHISTACGVSPLALPPRFRRRLRLDSFVRHGLATVRFLVEATGWVLMKDGAQ